LTCSLEMIECHFDAEPRAYITSMRVLLAITLPVDLFGVYCIVTRSPPVMKEYSRLLLIYQISATLTDTWTNMMFIPVALLPFPIAYSAGLVFPRTHMSYCYMEIIWLCLIVTTMGAVVHLFVFRWQSMLMNNHPLRLRKSVVVAICCVHSILCNAAVLGAGFAMPDRIDVIKPLLAQVRDWPPVQ
uniref:G protein-coupled receptor n=1 Tax=Heligmosomoides polygyrus TaxID=6339 RepID=A0A183GH53_HELPZ